MKELVRRVGIVWVAVALVACEKLKQKEVAQLPVRSGEDTLVLDTGQYDQDKQAAQWSGTNYSAGSTPSEGSRTGAANGSGGTSAGNEAEAEISISEVSAKAVPAKRKVYRKPSKAQLQQALAKDARLSERMSLTRLKRYWQYRQHYYRKAAREVKFVSGETKINITPEETKIETPKGKVKIEGSDIKVKPE
ncbi:MAG: hypothetical protein ACO1OQ_11610 [Rufibacter sp.]